MFYYKKINNTHSGISIFSLYNNQLQNTTLRDRCTLRNKLGTTKLSVQIILV